jgi:hypothetical protein
MFLAITFTFSQAVVSCGVVQMLFASRVNYKKVLAYLIVLNKGKEKAYFSILTRMLL